jgi:hypothetical protein
VVQLPPVGLNIELQRFLKSGVQTPATHLCGIAECEYEFKQHYPSQERTVVRLYPNSCCHSATPIQF